MNNITSDMSFMQHLEELRYRLARVSLCILVLATISFIWANFLFDLLTDPMKGLLEGASLIGTGPAEAFIVKLKVSLVAGFLASLPFSFYHLWKFVSPGLHENERKWAIPFVLFSTFFFILGIGFCYQMILPIAFSFFFNEFQSIGVLPTIKIGEYLSFTIKLLMVFGIVFELPVLSFFLSRLGLITHTWLIVNARYAILIIFVAAAILTPPDIATQLLLAAPLVVLYGLCIGIAYIFGKKSKS